MIFDCVDQRPQIPATMNSILLHGSLVMVLLSAALIMLATVDIDVT